MPTRVSSWFGKGSVYSTEDQAQCNPATYNSLPHKLRGMSTTTPSLTNILWQGYS
jgi:hypothetical protein